MSKQDKDKVIAQFTEAYKKANGKEPQVETAGGWYSVDGGKNMRLAQLEEWTEDLASGGKASAKTKPKPKSQAKSKAKKKTGTPSKKSTRSTSGDGFSVKDYWAEKIQTENAGAKLPR